MFQAIAWLNDSGDYRPNWLDDRGDSHRIRNSEGSQQDADPSLRSG
jgi:hypothetical protein